MRADDGRRATGARVLFNRETQAEAWYLARLLATRLSRARAHQLLLLALAFLEEDSQQATAR